MILSGAPCAGKSTVAKDIMESNADYFYLSSDALKNLFSDYDSGKYVEQIRTMLLSMEEILCKAGLNIVAEALHQEFKARLISVARAHGYEILEVNLEAPYEILLERFKERRSQIEARGEQGYAMRTEENFKANFDAYQREKNPKARTFDTTKETVKEITRNIFGKSWEIH